MKKIIRATPKAIAYLFTNGEHHYKVEGGLEEGYGLSAMIQEPLFPNSIILMFENDEPEPNNELEPTFTGIGTGI